MKWWFNKGQERSPAETEETAIRPGSYQPTSIQKTSTELKTSDDQGHELAQYPASQTVAARPSQDPSSTADNLQRQQTWQSQRTASVSSRRHPTKDPSRKELRFEVDNNRQYTAFAWSSKKKWSVLIVTALVQCSMNFNASVYPNVIPFISNDFQISVPTARTAQMSFLIAYAFGCELWAPWSEEIGRKPILQASLLLVNLSQIPAALAPNFGCMLAARLLCGLSSAGGSVTLGMVADMFQPHEHSFAVAHVVFSSVGGALLGPIVGGFIAYYIHWRWTFWIQLIFGVVVQLLHLVAVPETRSDVLLDREAARRRKLPASDKQRDADIYGPNEVDGTLRERLDMAEIARVMVRPFMMLVTEPIVCCLSLLSGFSDALIFTFLESFGLVYRQWGFNQWQVGLCFVTLLVGYAIAWLYFIPWFRRDGLTRRHDGIEAVTPERRLKPLLYTAPLLVIGIFGFAWTSLGPPLPWIGSQIFACLIGVANYAIYYSTIDYMMAAYGEYSASATGGNGFCRDLLAGIAAMYSTPMYEGFPGMTLEWASTFLGCVSVLVVAPIYWIYLRGKELRDKSPFAREQAAIIRQRTKNSVVVRPEDV